MHKDTDAIFEQSVVMQWCGKVGLENNGFTY